MNVHPLALAAFCIASLPAFASHEESGVTHFLPGEVWPDTSGIHINAHGAGILHHDGVYYMFGEHKSDASMGTRAFVGIRVYASQDLLNWTDRGVALPVSDDPLSEIPPGCVMERPKVIFNEHTGTFVMWFRLDLKAHGYRAARTAVAVADEVTGPYRHLYSTRPNGGRFPTNITDELKERVLRGDTQIDADQRRNMSKPERADTYFVRDFYGGQMARDMTLYQDDDGTAYHIFAAEENMTLHIAELDQTYTRHTGRYMRLWPGGHREAPAMFKRGDTYHLITSGCTGWKPNAAEHAHAPSIWGPWTITGNPAVGPQANITFDSQSTFVLPVDGMDDAFIFMGDRWEPQDPITSSYVWLPIAFEGDRAILRNTDRWGLDVFKRPVPARP